MKKVLFPTDFSDQSTEVFKYAADVAYFLKARLVIMHVLDKPNFQVTDEAMEHMAGVVSDQMLELVEEHLHEQYKEKLKIEYYSTTGSPADAILNTSLEDNIHLIVMGMKGKTNALEALMGSNTLKVLSNCACPILMVPEASRFQGIDNLVFTTNFEFRDLGGINYLKKWSRSFDAPIHCLHVIEEGEDEYEAVKNLGILHQTFKGHKRMFFDVMKGDFDKEIEPFARKKRADIVAMMDHKRSFIARQLELNDTVKGIARKIHLPLLVIKDNSNSIKEITDWLKLINSIA